MEAVREYLLSVTAAAVICGMLRSVTGEKGTCAGITKLICGLFLAFTVIRPIAEVEIEDFAMLTADISGEAREAVSMGEDYTRQAISAIIKSETEAYILDKAQAYDAKLQVEVTVSADDTPVPDSVRITGGLSPYARTQLQSIIENELGIPKENQRWIQ